jgi:predicted transcriptional regulator
MVCILGRRNDLDICAEILQIAKDGAKKTRIVYSANLNFKIVEKYLRRLIENGLLDMMDERRFITTRKGAQFLKQYRILVEPMNETLEEEIVP